MTTNREKLAKMTNEELANFLYNTTCCDRCSNKNRLDCYARFCTEGTLQWLNQECEVEDEYNTKDIRHINEKNQEYIAEGNRMTKMNREQKERLIEKMEYDIKSDMIVQEEKKKIKRSECPYGGIDCAWCGEDCE